MKLLKNKRAMELSINFIVMLILAIAVFAGGLVFASKFFGKAEKMRESLDSQTEKQIEKMLDSGSRVVLPIGTKEIFRKKFDTFALGVLANYAGTYEADVTFVQAFDKKKNPIHEGDPQGWVNLASGASTMELKKNEKGKMLIGVGIPKNAKTGTYIYKVTVNLVASDVGVQSPYDPPLQMIVKVP